MHVVDPPNATSVCSFLSFDGSDIQECNIECLEPDAFQVPGVRNISTVYIQTNVFTALPEARSHTVPVYPTPPFSPAPYHKPAVL